MKHELWSNEQELDTFCLAGPDGDGARSLMEPDSKLIWECEANSHFEAMTKYYQFRGWGEYTSDYPEIDKRPYCE
ncbi:hypothetical protein BCT38_20495 [Vibrio lentus]|nr:hypothetical protein BH583_06910 [Vibrio lentus]PMG59215.1 hypothetical protein BCU87_19250 [Vibrio lentus]PMJ09302.1 hypothetical protein BCU31_19100 [Vibrio lentus]PMN02205.1 hypothetical protein BCT40_24625 [Vibrio lentus]PMN13512.1 hypothetical protein BCT38_20495 [Vibrio lentus]